MHLIKETYIYYFLMLSNWVQGNSNGPIVTIGTNGKAPYSNGSIVEYASH